MELVEFMSNKECVVETFKVNGLIAKDNTVTEKGLMAIQFYLDMIEQKKPELKIPCPGCCSPWPFPCNPASCPSGFPALYHLTT